MKIPQIPSVKIVASSTPAKKSLKALRFIPNFSIEPDWYDIKLGSDYIGTASFTTTKAVLATKSDINRFPDAFISPTGNIKPYVRISYIEIFQDWSSRYRAQRARPRPGGNHPQGVQQHHRGELYETW